MGEQQVEPQVVFNSSSRNACEEARLVLLAASLPCNMFQHRRSWILQVSPEHEAAALTELAAYQQENQESERPQLESSAGFFGIAVGCASYVLVMVAVAAICDFVSHGPSWKELGHMQAGQVMAGQWWRTVTALTLHADALHLMSNLTFGVLFGVFVGQALGGGLAWLTIVFAGATGNAVNAFFRSAEHVSIGASTAVFAALGILVAHALQLGFSATQKPMRRWSPLVGGVLLLAFTGTEGERTDVGAHVAGFLAGLVLGWIVSRVPGKIMHTTTFQAIAGVFAFGTLLVSWFVAASSSP